MNVAIIDYGSGNLRSAKKAFEHVLAQLGGGKVTLASDPSNLTNATHIVLPGVGAFSDCKAGLLSINGMIDALHEQVINKSKPFLGICVGMQLMADVSHEKGDTNGFGWIPGEVVAITSQKQDLKIPHMGWNSLQINSSAHPAVSVLPNGAHTYFVHSYNFVTKDPAHVLATVNYGTPLNAIIGRDNIIGTQFHPEKSQRVGLAFISGFLRWHP